MFKLFKYNSDPIVATVERFFEKQNVKVTSGAIKDYILSHPDYPSLLSVSDCLTYFNIENVALRVSKEELEALPLPLIAFASNEFQIVNTIEKDKIEIIQNDGKKTLMNKNEFKERWSNIVLLSEIAEYSGERNENYRIDQKIRENFLLKFLTIIFVLFFGVKLYYLFTTEDLYNASVFTILYLLKIVGCIATIVLVWGEIDIYNPSFRKICSGLVTQSNCSAVLNSNYSKTPIGASWSEVGVIYFFSTFVLLLWDYNFMIILSILNIASLLIILLSLYVQAFLIKQWCSLCLVVQAILLVELIISMIYLINVEEVKSLSSAAIVQTIAIFAMSTPVLYIAKSIFVSKIEAESARYELKRIKRNFNIFKLFLSEKAKIEIPKNLGITIGNVLADNTLVKVCNPYCTPCAIGHPEIVRLVEYNKNVKVQILYNSTLQEYDKTKDPVRHFFALSQEKSQSELIRSLNSWYAKPRKYSEYSKENPINGNLNRYDSQIEAMHVWLVKNNILVTPTYFYNGSPLPSVYKISDLEYLNF